MLLGDYKYLIIPEFSVISMVDLKKKKNTKKTGNRINKDLKFCAERAQKIKSKGKWFCLFYLNNISGKIACLSAVSLPHIVLIHVPPNLTVILLGFSTYPMLKHFL